MTPKLRERCIRLVASVFEEVGHDEAHARSYAAVTLDSLILGLASETKLCRKSLGRVLADIWPPIIPRIPTRAERWEATR